MKTLIYPLIAVIFVLMTSCKKEDVSEKYEGKRL